MFTDPDAIVVAVITAGGVIAAAALALFGTVVGIMVSRISKMESRVDQLETDFGQSISLLNAVGTWIGSGFDPNLRPTIPDNLIGHITTWPVYVPKIKEASHE